MCQKKKTFRKKIIQLEAMLNQYRVLHVACRTAHVSFDFLNHNHATILIHNRKGKNVKILSPEGTETTNLYR